MRTGMLVSPFRLIGKVKRKHKKTSAVGRGSLVLIAFGSCKS
ncbi:hypothetical protein P8891_11465 [Bacillus atrophaeus]|nr:hypothetical protein [Bacillus atrophaeus]MEC0741681.1 hypothetical protein [Bacillus atrophaeus]MEC0745004.1 hypothetical protein [Bacillus atrophaeus]MEC0757995.1 hypothetical protein [Bacillus atrophaeus]MEC0914505.1 hypothetical protein [Bacillus atrophaeus]MEC0961083.1 hypothetical protein [Bacillus atrophaeus]